MEKQKRKEKKEWHSQIAPFEKKEWHSQIAPSDKKEWRSSITPYFGSGAQEWRSKECRSLTHWNQIYQSLVYDQNHYFGLGPKPKLADSLGGYCKRY